MGNATAVLVKQDLGNFLFYLCNSRHRNRHTLACVHFRRVHHQSDGGQGQLLDGLDAGNDQCSSTHDHGGFTPIKDARNDESLIGTTSHDPDVKTHFERPKLELRTANLRLSLSHRLSIQSIVVAQAKNSPLLLRVWRARVVELERQQHQEERVDVLGGSRQGGKLVEVAEGATCPQQM